MKIKRIDLEKIYRENSNKEACTILGICNRTLTAYLRQMGIKLKGSGNRNKKNKLTITG
jgi:hypothetical protein